MEQWPTTRNTLLVNLTGDENQAAWFEFSQRYEPVIYRFARQRGLQHVDAVELTQKVMLGVMKSARQWADDKPPEQFRAWLRKVASNSLINMVTRDAKHRAAGGSWIEPIDANSDDNAQLWSVEESRSVLRCAAINIRSEFSQASWIAFERTLIAGQSVEDVAAQINKSPGAVYAARARIMNRLKTETARILEAQQ